jgi:hypothetical protein
VAVDHRWHTATTELNVKQGSCGPHKTGELRAIQSGGRGTWRIGRQDLADYIAKAYRHTAERIGLPAQAWLMRRGLGLIRAFDLW